jgi:hypothetical protein
MISSYMLQYASGVGAWLRAHRRRKTSKPISVAVVSAGTGSDSRGLGMEVPFVIFGVLTEAYADVLFWHASSNAGIRPQFDVLRDGDIGAALARYAPPLRVTAIAAVSTGVATVLAGCLRGT